MPMTGVELDPSTPRQVPPNPLYRLATENPASRQPPAPGLQPTGKRWDGLSPGAQRKYGALADYVARLRAQGKVHLGPSVEEPDNPDARSLYGDDVSAEEDRKVRRGMRWLGQHDAGLDLPEEDPR